MRMSFMINQIIRRKKKKVYIYIYIYIYGYLINFNNLNWNEDTTGWVLWRGYVHPHIQRHGGALKEQAGATTPPKTFPIFFSNFLNYMYLIFFKLFIF